MLEEGSQTDLNDVKTAFFNNATGESLIPALISLSFIAVNGAPVIVFTEIEPWSKGLVANLGRPAELLSLDLPRGASVTTASGVFDNFVSATVPEPSTWAMVLVGFAALGFAGYRRTRKLLSIAV